MEALRKLSSMGRSKDSKEAAKTAVQQASEEPEEQRVNGGGANVQNTEADLVGPSPPRARVTDDGDDDVEVAGDDDGYDSAVERIGTSSTPSVVDESQSPKESLNVPLSFAQALRKGGESQKEEDTETEAENEKVDEPRESSSNSADEESSSSSAELEEQDEEDDGATLSRESSVRAMPVAKLTTENEEQEEEADDDDEDEGDNADEYEEANDQVLGEEEDAHVDREDANVLPRIIARETDDDHFDEVDSKEEESSAPSSAAEEDVEQAASTPLPDDQVEKSIPSESSATKNTEPAAPSPAVEENADDTLEEEPRAEDGAVEGLKEEDNSNVVEKPVDDVASGREDQTPAVVAKDQHEEAVPEASSSPAEPAPLDIKAKEEVAPEVAPLATADVGSASDEVDAAEKAKEEEQSPVAAQVEVESRNASSSLLEELRKLSASRSLPKEEVKPETVTETAAGQSSEGVVEEEKKESTATEPAPDSEPKASASNSLLAELKKLADARSQREASEPDAKKAGETTSEGSGEQATEKDQGSSDPVVDQKGVDSSEDVAELKELTSGLHVQGRSKSEISEVQSALATSSDSAEKAVADSTSTVTISESLSPEGAEVRIIEESKPEEADSAAVKEDAEGPAAAPSPAKLPASKPANGEAAETENAQIKSRGFSAADISGGEGDSDADAEDEDEDDDEDDEDDEDDADMDTAKALAELANAVGKSRETGNKSSMGAAGPSLPSLPQRPAVRKSAAASAIDTAGRIAQRPTAAASTQLATTADDSSNGETAEGNETREKLQNIRVKFLRLAHRLGQSPQNVVVAQVLYRLGLAESLRGGSAPNRTGAFSFDRANALAEEQEAANQDEELDFACTILVLGKTGVGKSATINSIFDDRKSVTSAFKPSTNKVQEIVGTVHGIKVRVIDTPGLLPSVADQQHNERTMGQVKKHIKKSLPDIVLYFDRLDMQSRDYGDLPLLRTITDLFGAAVWFNAIVVLTHASSAPPDGPNGVPLSYEMFVAQRSHVVQQTIRQAAGDMRLMNPVSLVENHPACRTNRNGQRVLPNGQIWKPQLLLLCFASKILAEANSLLKLQETATPGRPFGQRSRVPPLPFLLSSLLQSRAQLKLPDEQLGESDESDDDEEEEDSDADDYDELPPFRPLSKEELEDLDKEQKQQYMEEIADRERLFQKKQYREEMRRRKEMKKRAAQMSKEELAQPDEADDEAGKAAAVPVPMPDMALPPSFDSDNPTHRYRYLETANQWLVRPVLETHGWDHDAGYDGFNVEKMFVVKEKIPASVSGQVTKDKKEAQVNFEAAASLKHGEGKVTLTGFDIQTIGKDLAYTLRAETRFNNWKRNKTTAGVTCTVLNDTVAGGLKLEDRILIGKRMKMVVNGGVLAGKGDKAFGGSLEATLRGKDYPLSRTLSTLGLSVMDWHGDLAIGGNLQSQFMVGKTMLVGRANLNNRGSGQVSIRASSSEQLQMALIGIVPILRSLINCRFGFGGQSSQ